VCPGGPIRIVRIAALLLAMALTAIAAPAQAQTPPWPVRAITIVVPYPAGGSIDLVAREVGHWLAAALGQPVIVENVGGASGDIGSARVARAKPDGYTVLLTTNAPLVFNRFLLKQNSFDPVADFEPIIFATVTPIALAVNPALPVNSVADYVAYARDHPGEIDFASSGVGSPHHVDGEMLKAATGIDIRHVPYRGAAPAITDVAGGHVKSGFITLGLISQLAADGKIRILAVTDDERSDLAPNVPAITETFPAYRGAPTGWHAFLAPRGTPAFVIERLNSEIGKALADVQIRAQLRVAGVLAVGGTPAALTERIKSETETVRAQFKRMGITPE
jgi:tripartite-type tricarboxylate transporter receptor subunit TctC